MTQHNGHAATTNGQATDKEQATQELIAALTARPVDFDRVSSATEAGADVNAMGEWDFGAHGKAKVSMLALAVLSGSNKAILELIQRNASAEEAERALTILKIKHQDQEGDAAKALDRLMSLESRHVQDARHFPWEPSRSPPFQKRAGLTARRPG